MAKDLSLKILINAQDNTGNAFDKTRQSLVSINEQLDGFKNRLTGLLGLSVTDILFGKAADSYKTLEARLKLVKEFTTAQSALFDVLLGDGFNGNKTHSGTRNRFANDFSIVGIVFIAFNMV
jgi:hypothetical protein